MSLITDALRKADSSLSTPPQAHAQSPSPKPTVDLTPPSSPPAPWMRWSHGLFLIGCVAAGYFLFAYHPARSFHSQKIQVMRIPRSVTRLPASESRFQSTPSPSLSETGRAPISPAAGKAASPAIGGADKIGMDMLQAMAGQWRLNGIIRGGAGRPLALVNNELVQEGDSFHGARVARISNDQVVLEADGQLQTLRLD